MQSWASPWSTAQASVCPVSCRTALEVAPELGYYDQLAREFTTGAEVRWTPARFLDMALFYDTGKVAARRQDLDFTGLRDAYGIGMRLVGPHGYALRVEVAHSREHAARLLVGGGGTF